jgi:hypothetical protein
MITVWSRPFGKKSTTKVLHDVFKIFYTFRLRSLYESCKKEAEERCTRLELFSHSADYIGGKLTHPAVQDGLKKQNFPSSWPTYLNVIKTEDEFNADTNENDLLLENEQILEGSGRQLDRGRRLLKETEDIGAGVLSDLGETHR